MKGNLMVPILVLLVVTARQSRHNDGFVACGAVLGKASTAEDLQDFWEGKNFIFQTRELVNNGLELAAVVAEPVGPELSCLAGILEVFHIQSDVLVNQDAPHQAE